MTNVSGSALTNYQTKLTLDSSTFSFMHALADGRDLRVTDSTGTTLIPFWIEAWDAAALRATVWVRVTNVPTMGATLYIYSGNTAAVATGSAASTFDVYDGFESLAVGGSPDSGTGVTWSVGGVVSG